MAVQLKPLADRVVVQPAAAEEKTKSGIIIPDTAKEKPIKGKVIAAGPGRRLDSGEVRALTVKEGDIVLFSKYGGTDVKIDGEDHLILREDDILGIIG
jgi:chaperonin GroES